MEGLCGIKEDILCANTKRIRESCRLGWFWLVLAYNLREESLKSFDLSKILCISDFSCDLII